jgi:hypothetical protein
MTDEKPNLRWQGQYEGLEDQLYPRPEVWAKTEEEALEKAKKAFEGLAKIHKEGWKKRPKLMWPGLDSPVRDRPRQTPTGPFDKEPHLALVDEEYVAQVERILPPPPKKPRGDFSWQFFCPINEDNYDPSKVRVVCMGTGMFKVSKLEVKPMEPPDFSALYETMGMPLYGEGEE